MNNEHSTTSPCPSIDALVGGLELGLAETLDHVGQCRKCSRRADRIRQDNALARGLSGINSRALAQAFDDAPTSALEPTAIPGYEILNELHRGGQGVVYMALRLTDQSPVAIKTLLNGAFATSRQQRRFEREIDLVGSLQQDNIVRLFDSGVTTDNKHYLVMEYIDGKPLDHYLNGTNGAPPPQPAHVHDLLRMFDQVCKGVEHAHRNGVIHRDLKPSNILVDRSGTPHVVDFGLAKTLAHEDSAATLPGEFMGTFAYASPEQLKSDPDNIDTRSDVYSLGVILYQMLTKRLPFDLRGSMSEALRRITEVDPDPPSTSRPAINNELDTIVLKALSKEPGRRYQTVAALREDIDNFLSGRPLSAKRDSSLYILRKLMRRHRGKIIGGTLGVLLVATLITLLFTQRRADRIENVDKPFNEGIAFQRKSSWTRAAKRYEAVLELDPDHFRALVNLAIVKKEHYYQTQDPADLERAATLLERATDLHPQRKEVWNMQAIVERIRGNFDASRRALDRAIDIDPQYYPMWVNRGLVNALQLDLEAAEADLLHSLELAAEPPGMALHNLAAVRHQLDRADAMDYCNAAVEGNLQNTGYRLLRAKIALVPGEHYDPKSALSDAITADQLTPDEHYPTKRVLALTRLHTEDWIGAVEAADEALDFGDPTPHVHLIKAVALARLGDEAAARDHLASAIEATALFTDTELLASDDRRLVWFDNLEEVSALRDELEQLLGP